MLTVGQEIKRLRKQRRLQQADVARRGGLSSTLISRIESGIIKSPTIDTLEKIAVGLGVPVETLVELAMDPGEISPFRIGCTHSLHAGPLLLMKMDGLAGFQFSSGLNEAGLPDWEQPRPADAAQTFTAADLLARFANGELDCIAAAKDVFEGLGRAVMPFVQIAHMFAGCELLIFKSKDHAIVFGGQGTDEFKPIRDLSQADCRLLYPRYTIAEKYIDSLRDLCRTLTLMPVELGCWSGVRGAIKDGLGQNQRVLLLGWEPQLSWALDPTADWDCEPGNMIAFLLKEQSEKKRKSVPYFTFDILLRTDSEKVKQWIQRGEYKRLVPNLKRYIEYLNTVKDPQDDVVARLAGYLKMPPNRCFSALGHYGFLLRYHEEFVNYLQESI